MSLWRQVAYGLRSRSPDRRAIGRLPMKLSSISSRQLLI